MPTEIYLGNTNDKSSTEETDIEVEVNFEPIPEGGTGGAPAGSDDSKGAEKSLDFEGVQDIKGGSSFSDAVEVKPGAYKDAIVPGEYRFYKIPVEYGQRPVVNFRSGANEREGIDELSASLYTPLRQEVMEDYAFLREEDDSGSLVGGVVEPGKENAGYYFVGVVLTQGSEDDVMGVEQPFEIAFDAVGEKTDGPEWRPTDKDGPEPSDTPPDTGEKKDGDEKSDDTDTQAQDESGNGGLGTKGILMLGLGIGIVVLLAALAGIIALLRRR